MHRLTIGAALMLLCSGCLTPDLDAFPRRSAPDSPRTSPSAEVQPSPVPTPAKKRNQVTNIYVVAPIASKWGLPEVLVGWNKAKWVDLKLARQCPLQAQVPCVTITESNSIPGNDMGETIFYNTPSSLQIHVDHNIRNYREAQSTLCHELGHIMGLGHSNRQDTCMTIERVGPLVPTERDLLMVDRLGYWTLEKVGTSSGRDID
jgi:matrixin